jgi:hypothetical protein
VTHAIEEIALRTRRFFELAIALHELARAQLHLGLEALARLDHLADFLPVAADSLANERDYGERL